MTIWMVLVWVGLAAASVDYQRWAARQTVVAHEEPPPTNSPSCASQSRRNMSVH